MVPFVPSLGASKGSPFDSETTKRMGMRYCLTLHSDLNCTSLKMYQALGCLGHINYLQETYLGLNLSARGISNYQGRDDC
jgi:UDP-2,3-diacylglucosamine pyrophosphatase LpxH